jgi:hypothetical protein
MANVRFLFHLAERHPHRSIQPKRAENGLVSAPYKEFTKSAQS